MNIQIFGTKKCNETKKAQRYFKERGIQFQFIDMNEKGMSKGELRSVCQVAGGIDAIINEDCKKWKTSNSWFFARCVEGLGIGVRCM